VTGVSGSGKSSTIAAMLNHVNQGQHRHVVTIENPIEFLHRDLSSSMTQREVGVDTESVAVGLRAALRQDPDVVMVGDIRDQDTIDTAMKAAETGHLVIGAMPTPDVMTTIGQVLSMLPREEREIGRVRFSEALLAIVSQQLLPRADGGGRVAAVEVLVGNPAVRDCLKDPARIVEIRSLMSEGYGKSGMQTFQQSVDELAESGLISPETARAVGGSGPAPERREKERDRKGKKGSGD
jgi:twitching motility protein PilT